jgi:hypothetical protein
MRRRGRRRLSAIPRVGSRRGAAPRRSAGTSLIAPPTADTPGNGLFRRRRLRTQASARMLSGCASSIHVTVSSHRLSLIARRSDCVCSSMSRTTAAQRGRCELRRFRRSSRGRRAERRTHRSRRRVRTTGCSLAARDRFCFRRAMAAAVGGRLQRCRIRGLRPSGAPTSSRLTRAGPSSWLGTQERR